MNESTSEQPSSAAGRTTSDATDTAAPARPTLDSFLERVPKVELHSHLIGAMRPSTLDELAAREGLRLPRPAAELFPYANFYEFIDVYNNATRLLKSRDDFARVIFEVLEDGFVSSNQRHTEMFFNPQYSMALGIPYATIADGLADGIALARQRHGVSCLLIPSISREIDARGAGEVLDAVLGHRLDEVVGVGMDGPERAGPPARFADFYRRAGQAGLKRTAHVCEDNQTLQEAPPSNFAVCADELGCDRFDHGYNLLADDDMIARARDEGRLFTAVPIPSSLERRQTRLASIARMVDEGLQVTINTDDSSMFGTNLAHSYKAVCAECGWDHRQATRFSLAGVDACWLDDGDKRRLRADFEAQIRALGEPSVSVPR